MRKYFFNENFFRNIDTEQKAYWLGFFYADGHITDRSLICSLKATDDKHLEKFLKDIEANNIKVKYYDNCGHKYCTIFLNSSIIVNDLRLLGFTNRKTYDNSDYIFQCVSNNLKRHFIRGFWDGDGSVQLRQGKFGAINVVSLNQKLLQSFCNYFNEYFNDSDFSRVVISEEKYYRIILGSEKAKKVCHLFYDNSSIYLDRKYQNFLKFKTYDKNYKGIRQRKSGKYQVYMYINCKQVSFGTYNTLKEAVEVYNQKAKELKRPIQKYYGESLKREESRII